MFEREKESDVVMNWLKITFVTPILIGLLAASLLHPVATVFIVGTILFMIISLKRSLKKSASKGRPANYLKWVKHFSMRCHKCGKLVQPSYINIGTGHHRYEELWKYNCNHCGMGWKEYWPISS